MLNHEFQDEYRPGNNHLRLYIKAPTSAPNGHYQGCKSNMRVFVVANDIPSAIIKEELIKAMDDDRELQKLIACIHKKFIYHRAVDVKVHSGVFNKLTVVKGLVLVT